jgi:hypothetical protein
MVQDIRVKKIFEVLFAPEDTVEIYRGALLTGLDDTANLIFNVENALSGV